MAYYTELDKGTRHEITDENFTDDPDMEDVWESTLERVDTFEIAVSEHLTYIGKLPISIKEDIERNPELQKPVASS